MERSLENTVLNRAQWKRATPWDPQPLSQKNYVPMVTAALVEALLYGVHFVLFAICVYLLLARRMRLQWIMFSGVIAMFILSTADIAITWHFVLHQPASMVQGTTISFLTKLFAKLMIFVTNDLIAVALLIARCYVVYGQKLFIPVIAGALLLMGTGLGYASQISNPQTMRVRSAVWFLLAMVLNNVLTVLTAGRIWALSRRVSPVMGARTGNQYRRTSAIIVESGLLYSLSMIVCISLLTTRWAVLGCAIMIRTVCIMPVMIVVQIAVGHATSPPDIELTTTGINTERRPSLVLDTIVTRGGAISSSSVRLSTHSSLKAG